jgi:uncharacterized protein
VRLLLDTNIVVSGFLWGGLPQMLLDQATLLPRSSLALYTSPFLIQELDNTLSKPKLAKDLLRKRTSVGVLMMRYLAITSVVTPSSVPRIVPNDRDDDHVIAAALTAEADFIVTGDKNHLLSLHPIEGINIITARMAIERLR